MGRFVRSGASARWRASAPRDALVGLLVSLASAGAPARAAPCDPVRVATAPGSLPAPWAIALEAMIEATRREGTPWSCSAGVITLTVGPDDQATLRLEEPGRAPVERRVAAPAQLVPTALALLAVPAPPAAPPAPTAAPTAAPAAPAPPPVAPPARRAPRVLVDTLFAGRWATPSPGPWLGGELRVTLPLGEWSVGLAGRYDLLLAFARGDGRRESMSEVAVGPAVGRRLLKAPIELYATLEPRLAVLVFEAQTATDRTAGAQADLRVATGLRAAHRISESARWVLALDAELAPSAAAGAVHAEDETHARPVFGVGLGVGLEAAIE